MHNKIHETSRPEDAPLNIVCIGGGTGTFSVVSALAALPVNISCVIAVSDSGGSTGRIRDEFGFQPVGDLRQSLAALADPQGQEWVQKLLLYRFSKGAGLQGHNLGNLILTALQDMVGNTTEALAIAEKAFQLRGSVIPVTETAVDLQITYQDGSTAIGEHLLDETLKKPKEISSVKLIPECIINPKAIQAFSKADIICIGPGDYYASLMACLMVPGLKESVMTSPAACMYMSNLMTRRTQTHGMTARDHVLGIENAIGRPLDYILINSAPIPTAIIDRYAAEDEYEVADDLTGDQRVIRAPVAASITVEQSSDDTAHRSLLRHDPIQLRQVFSQLLTKEKK